MKKQKKLIKIRVFTLIVFLALLICNSVFATNVSEKIKGLDYSKEYLEWLKLDEETKKNSIMPRRYNVYSNPDKNIQNPLKAAIAVQATTTNKFNLNDYIKRNLVIKNQKRLGSCWAFAGMGSIETNLALTNYYNNKTEKLYDFSERYMEYVSSQSFLNNEVNPIGGNRKVGDGGAYSILEAYITNGSTPINEADMPYTDTSENINLSEIQNKKVTAEISDIAEFEGDLTTNNEIKKQIKNYGGVYASIHEGDTDVCINNKTGALYCNSLQNHVSNHAVLIVGWDDNYSVDNFCQASRPSNPGAWIVRDSHGDNAENTYTYDEVKKSLFEFAKDSFIQSGITSADQISDEFVTNYATQSGYTIVDGKIFVQHNDDGYLYVSNEDVNIFSNGLMGIVKASDNVQDNNIYQHNVYGVIDSMSFTTNKIYLAETFKKNSTETEYLNKVSLSTPETVTCKVYVNPNGKSKAKDDLQLVNLKEGETQTIDAGYHTLEFASPVEIKNDEFTVVILVEGKRTGAIGVSIEYNVPEFYKKKTGNDIPSYALYSFWGKVNVKSNMCFAATEQKFEKNTWDDTSNLYTSTSGIAPDSNLSIKAFTTTKTNEEKVLKEIKITTPPTKTVYQEGENFDKQGMVVKAVYQDNTENEITNYTIKNGENLKTTQTAVTISFEGKTVSQAITVKAKQSEDTQDINPKNSDFTGVSLKVNSVKYYTFTNKDTKEYVTLNLTIDNILRNSINDGYKYYYYLSPNQTENSTKVWTEIKNAKTDNNKLEFEINTSDIKNYSEIIKGNSLYLYIKEIATKGTKETSLETNAIKIESTVKAETYVDNVKKDDNRNEQNNNENNNQNNNENNTSKEENNIQQIQPNLADTTKSSNILPHTGFKSILIIIGIIALIGILAYFKYKKLSKYIK